jgi:hypothetical protein
LRPTHALFLFWLLLVVFVRRLFGVPWSFLFPLLACVDLITAGRKPKKLTLGDPVDLQVIHCWVYICFPISVQNGFFFFFFFFRDDRRLHVKELLEIRQLAKQLQQAESWERMLAAIH